MGHASAQATLDMVAGSKVAGGFRDKNVVIKYEHEAACALRLRSAKINHAIAEQFAAQALPQPPEPEPPWDVARGTFQPILFHCYLGDATNQEAIQKEKIHVSEICSASVSRCAFEAATQGDDLSFEALVVYNRALPDIQPVKLGTGRELYSIMLKELRGVGINMWLVPHDGVVCMGLALDHGPDNDWVVGFITSLLGKDLFTWCCGVWCFFHQYHLIVKAMISVLDSFTFSERDFDSSYFSAVATIANTWRTPGNPRKILDAACQQFGDSAGVQHAKRFPGRAKRGRWGSIDSVEELLDSGGHVLAWVFASLFVEPVVAVERAAAAKAAKAKAKAAQAGADASHKRRKRIPGDDEQEEERAKRKSYAFQSGKLMSSSLFRAMMKISLIAKSPLTHLFRHAQKKRGAMIAERRKSQKCNFASLEITFLSELVCSFAGTIMGEICALLAVGADEDIWGRVWHLLPERNLTEARALIVHLVIVMACEWQMRFVSVVEDFPLVLLTCLESPPNVDCAKRRSVAERLLNSCQSCLKKKKCSDVTSKIRELYNRDWIHSKDTGRCTWGLYVALLSMRSVLRGDTQEIEGWNNVLQVM